MSTVEFDSVQLARFRQDVLQWVKTEPDMAMYQKEATKLAHMNDRQLWATIKLHSFLSWIEHGARENLRRDRMTPVRTLPDDGEEGLTA